MILVFFCMNIRKYLSNIEWLLYYGYSRYFENLRIDYNSHKNFNNTYPL